ncbi:MAG TPA: zinc-ribbon domain-containing protein [Thermoplasmata archaeon]|nr:zinc-ribbon domain-containing protein [Thermoplasmata archaeon]
MKFQGALDNLPQTLIKGLLAFRKSVYFRIFYLAVLSVMVAALTLYGIYLGCLSILFSAILMFGLPYWLKERRIKHLALNGAVIFVAAALIFAALFAQSLSGNDPIPIRATGAGNVTLSNATVIPGRGPPGASYMFVANLTVPGTPNPGNYAVYVNLTTVDGVTSQLNMTPVNAADTNLSDGKAYNYTVPVGDRIYLFWFLVTVRNGTSFAWFESPWQVGPITAGYGTFYGFALYYGTFALILPMSLYFILLMLFWWTSRARMERQRLGMATPAETDTGFMCTNCGADVPAAAAKCPKCGAVFEEAPEPASKSTEPEGTSGDEGPESDEGADAKP